MTKLERLEKEMERLRLVVKAWDDASAFGHDRNDASSWGEVQARSSAEARYRQSKKAFELEQGK
tara:strand:+ start:71 stop:262 length:192 start_codon:yes stop_codon:yes gene_type:complete